MTKLKISGDVYFEGPFNFPPTHFDRLDVPTYLLVMTPAQIEQLKASPDFTFNQDKSNAETNQ